MNASQDNVRNVQVEGLIQRWLDALHEAGLQRPPPERTARPIVEALLRMLPELLAGRLSPPAAVEPLRPFLQHAARIHTARGGVPIPDYIRGVYLLQGIVLEQAGGASGLLTVERERIADYFNELIAAASEYWMEEFYLREDALQSRAAALADAAQREETMRRQLATTVDDLQSVLDATDNGIVVIDEQAQVRYVNHVLAQIFGLDAEGSVGRDIRESLLPVMCRLARDAEGLEARSRYFYDHLDEENRDEIQLDGDEERILVRFGGPVRGESGRLLGRIEVFNDVTALRRAEQVKDEFLSIAAHELKTPITSLKGYAQLLQRAAARGAGSIDAEQVGERLAAMLRQIDRLTNLVNDLLEVSRIQTGRMALRLEVVDLCELVVHVVDRFRGEPALSNHFQLEVRDVRRPLTGSWDPGRLDQVLTNLLNNALKYSPGGGLIQVRIGRSGDLAKVSVSDQGIGIPRAEIEKLFQPFARAANASVRNFTGIGLGLFISRDIVERHGGRIWVESQEGRGSTFSFTLPLRHRGNPSAVEENDSG